MTKLNYQSKRRVSSKQKMRKSRDLAMKKQSEDGRMTVNLKLKLSMKKPPDNF